MSALLIATGIVLFFILIAAADWERDKKRAAERQRRYNENNTSTQKTAPITSYKANDDADKQASSSSSISNISHDKSHVLLDNGHYINGECHSKHQTNLTLFDAIFTWKSTGNNITELYYGRFSINGDEKQINFVNYKDKDAFFIKEGDDISSFMALYYGCVRVVSPCTGLVYIKSAYCNMWNQNRYPQYIQPDSVILIIDSNPDVIAKCKKDIEDDNERERVRIIEKEKKEIAAKIKERHRLRQLEKEVEMELIEKGEILKDARRPPIPRDVRDAVYNRDGGRCVECGSTDNLHFDHIIPFSKGGASNVENLQILCQKCNLAKSNKIG